MEHIVLATDQTLILPARDFNLVPIEHGDILRFIPIGWAQGLNLPSDTDDPRRRIRVLLHCGRYPMGNPAAIRPGRHFRAHDVVACLGDLFISHGVPEHVRSDNGPEFTATVVREWLGRIGSRALFIEPGSPWENGYVESFNGKLRDELLDREVFYTLKEVEVVVEHWRRDYNQIRPHSALGYRPPAPEAILVDELLPAPAGLT